MVLLYLSGVIYVCAHDLSFGSLFKYGLLQPRGITGAEARLAGIKTPLSWNILQVLWFIYIKGSAVLVELFQYWVVGMVIAAALVAFVPWEKIKKKMGYGGFGSNFVATVAGAVIPICSCGIVPVLAGMVEAGIPLGPTMAFLIAAPMLNVPAVFITAGVLGWKLAIGRILGTFFIALSVGGVLAYWQRKQRFLRRFIKLAITPTQVVVNFVGGESLNSVLVAAAVAVLAYVCTYVEVPTALALIQKGMGGGATLAYLLGGPGLSLPSIAMLSGVFKPKVLVLYVAISFVGCVIAGYVYSLF